MSSIITLIVIIYLISYFRKSIRKGKDDARARKAGGYRPTPNRPRAASGRTPYGKPAGKHPAAPRQESKGTPSFDWAPADVTNYNMPTDRGITFRGLPEGADELAILIRYNRAHEKELERALESREG